MEVKKSLVLILSLIFLFSVFGFVSAETTLTLTNPSAPDTYFSGMETISWSWDGTNPSGGWSINLYWGPAQENSETVLEYIGASARSWFSFDTTEYDDRIDYYVEIVNNDNPVTYHDMSDNSFILDNNAPEIGEITISPIFGDYISETSDISASVNDNEGSGVDSCEYTLDGGTSWTAGDINGENCEATGIDTTSATAINMKATDNAENSAEGIAVSVTLDNSDPIVSITSPSINDLVRTPFDLTLSSSDTGSEVQICWYTIDSDLTQHVLANCNGVNPVSLGVSDGHHDIKVFAEDGVGHISSSASVEIILDTDNILTVDDSGGADYTTIQAAIDVASEGDIIYIREGTYVESVTVDKRLSIFGAGKDQSIINPPVDQFGFRITADNVAIQNLQINIETSGVNTQAIRVEGSPGIIILGNKITTTGDKGIGIWACGSNNGCGNVVAMSISNNEITINDVSTGIYSDFSNPQHSTLIIKNNIINSG